MPDQMVYYLPNLDRPQDAPSDWDAFWTQAQFMLDLIRCDLEKEIQSREEALADGPDRLGEVLVEPIDKADRTRYDIIRFRKSDDPDQLAYFHDLGRRTLEIVEALVEARAWTPEFAHHWSVLMFAHGFIMPSSFAFDSDLTDDRRGLRGGEATSREAQRRWYSHYLVREFQRPLKRRDADDRILRLVDALIAGTVSMPPGFDAAWFKKLKDDSEFGLSSTLEQLTRPKAQKFVDEGLEGLPPIDLPIP